MLGDSGGLLAVVVVEMVADGDADNSTGLTVDVVVVFPKSKCPIPGGTIDRLGLLLRQTRNAAEGGAGVICKSVIRK